MNVVITAVCLVVGVQGFSPLSPDEELYQKHTAELERQRRTKRQTDAQCTVQDFVRMARLENLEELVQAVAKEKGVTASVLLNRLLRKVKAKQRAEKMRNRSSLQEIAFKELLTTMVELPPLAAKPPPQPAGAAFPTELRQRPPPVERERMQLPFPPQVPPPVNPERMHFPFSPPRMQPKHRTPGPPPRHLDTTLLAEADHRIANEMDRSRIVLIPLRTLRPPPGVTVKVNTGGAEAAVPDVTVDISPMMTVVEALRQAEIKFQQALGLSPDDYVIAFNHATFAGCYIVSRFDKVQSTSQLAWKIAVSDREGRVLYDNICVPLGKEMIMMPGMVISLSYTAL